ncbi:restriction endonuclease subunit S [Agromyces ramosus]|uniref:Type I restriction enzyme S subunit n=1 Tax=Agromyces ramosus TaxID=33879 RepID=A0ABU0R9S6_9MICO|nr:hypothetical protein [Agromyces ramosus]MDQ0894487.1 type I restriction enzyme S subunit [Agromyces ramosus]
MRDGWQQVTLGELFEPSNERLGDHDAEPTVFSISKHDGVMPADEFFEKRVASSKLHDYKVLPNDAWVYSTIHIDEGSIARNSTGVAGVVSPMYTVMRWVSERDDAMYGELLLRSAKMMATYSDNARGSINRRRSLPWSVFRDISIALPPLHEQHRIVDLISAVDHATKTAEEEARSCAALRRDAIDSLINAHDSGERVSLGQLGTFERGKRFTKKDYVPDGLGCIHYGQIYTSYGATATETISFLPESFRAKARLARSGDLVIAGTGENVEDIGKAVAWLGEDDVAVHDDAYIYRHSLDPAYASALFASTAVRSQRAPSDSKVARLSSSVLASISVPVVGVDAQRQIGALMGSLDDAAVAARTAAALRRDLRSNLLTVLLSGEHEIPPSYDKLLGEVAA